MNYIDYHRQIARGGEIMKSEKPLIDVSKIPERRRDMNKETKSAFQGLIWAAVACLMLCTVIAMFFGELAK